MGNADRSAYPVHPKVTSTAIKGLTKRERLAMAAMQGACASRYGGSEKEIAREAVSQADALLNELENTNEV